MNEAIKGMFKYQSDFPGVLGEFSTKRFKHEDYGSVHSVSGTATSASLTVYKALRLYTKIKEAAYTKAGFGTTAKGILVAEIYHAEEGKVDMAAVSARGFVSAGTYDMETEIMSDFHVGKSKRGGTVIFLAIMEKLLQEDEAKEVYEKIMSGLLLDPELVSKEDWKSRTSYEVESWMGLLATISENFYYRVAIKNTRVNVNLSIVDSGECKKFASTKINAGEYCPKTYLGEFKVLMEMRTPTRKKVSKEVPSSIRKKYELTSRILSDEEMAEVPNLPDSIIVPKEVLDTCEMIKGTYDSTERIMNVMFSGEAGSGKTTAAKCVAMALNRPYKVFTCHTDTDAFALYGELIPNTKKREKGKLDISVDEFLTKHELPTVDDVQFSFQESYQKLTGEKDIPIGYSKEECMTLLLQKVIELTSDSSGDMDFTFVESPIIQALKHGYVLEIQEIKAISRPGVMMALNSLLENDGMIQLQTGEVISRHPETVIIATTNDTYKGCEELNESVLDRFQLVYSMQAPEKDEMIQRVIERTGFSDAGILDEMANVIIDVNEHIQKNDLHGVCGMRSFFAWVMAVKIQGLDTIYDNAVRTVINKASTDIEEREALTNEILDATSFAVSKGV